MEFQLEALSASPTGPWASTQCSLKLGTQFLASTLFNFSGRWCAALLTPVFHVKDRGWQHSALTAFLGQVRLPWHWIWCWHLFCPFPGELPYMSHRLVGWEPRVGLQLSRGEMPLAVLTHSLGGVCWLSMSSMDLWVSWGARGGSLGGCSYQAASCKCLGHNCSCPGAGDRLPQVPSMSSTEHIYI